VRRILLAIVMAVVAAVPARAVAATAIVDISASPNPAPVGEKVVHVVKVGAYGTLDIWVSAAGFEQPRLGALPPGRWRLECCSSFTGGTSAWHFRSSGIVAPASYRFRALARAKGTFASTAAVGSSSDVVWIRIT
jgi:hypothetical protein